MVSVYSPLQMAVDALLDRNGRVWLTGSQSENKRKYALILQRIRPDPKSGKDMKIDLCCGELSPLLFNDIEVVQGLQWALASGAKVRVIFCRGENAAQAIESLRKTNPNLCELWDKEPDNFTIYRSPIPMQQHFLAISGNGVLFEKPGTDKSKRPWWAFFERDKDLAEKWTARFEGYLATNRLTELPHDQIKPTTQN
jgi:hypothetical protein